MENKFYTISRYIKYIIFALLIASLIIPFGPAIIRTVPTGGNGHLSTPFGTAFNFMFTNTIYAKTDYQTNAIAILPLIAYILIVLSFVLMLLNTFNKKSKQSIIITPLILIFTFTASILVLSSHKEMATILTLAITKNDNVHVIDTIYKQTSLGIGLYGIAIFGFISAFGSLVNLFLEGTVDKIRDKFKK